MGRAASRGFRDANYTYSSAPPGGSENEFDPEPAALYGDGVNFVVGDHAGTTAQQNPFFLAAHLVPHVLESQGQLIELKSRGSSRSTRDGYKLQTSQ